VSGLDDLIARLTDPSVYTHEQACALLDEIHGDLTPNALFMALKEPWRHPFNRVSLATDSCSPCDSLCGGKSRRQLWGEFTARYEDVKYDNNAHPFTINRYGLSVGMDKRISQRSVMGLTYQYAEPRLRQATGTAKMDDHEVGLYGMTRLTDQVDMKVYLGYSHQQYDFDRRVFLPLGTLYEELHGGTSGDAMALSVELIKPMMWRKGIKVLPVAAFDFEQAWMKGFRESGGDSALVYDDATVARAMIRVGLGSEYVWRERFSLNARLQYAAQLNHREYPAVGVRFANGSADQYTADIWGSQIGRDYVNFGLGTSWKLGNRGNKLLYVNYDAKWFDRANLHMGEAGFVKRW
jgi:uncharacterized protein with beta-barrel porin domain